MGKRRVFSVGGTGLLLTGLMVGGQMSSPSTLLLPAAATTSATPQLSSAANVADLRSRTQIRRPSGASATTTPTPTKITPSPSPTTNPLPSPPAIPLSPSSWSTRQVIGSAAVTDSQGRVWKPATGVSGGTTVQQYGGIGDTASQVLYQTAQLGIASWTVAVAQPGRYAIDLLAADAQNTLPGARKFDVVADTGSGSVTLAHSLDIVASVKGYHPQHVTGVVKVSGTTLQLRFPAAVGKSLVTALAVTAYGPQASATRLDDNFDGPAGSPASASTWGYDLGNGLEDGSVENYTNSRGNSALDGKSNLAITARRNSLNGWDSARLTTKGKFTFTYGTISVRAQVPSGQGLLPAIWSIGSDIDTVDWPTSGEMDIMEHLGNDLTGVSGHVHSLGDAADPVGYRNQHVSNVGRDWDSGVAVSQAFHTYSIDVQPDAVTFRFDGQPYFTAAPEDLRPGQVWAFNKPFYLIMQIAVGGVWQGQPGPSTPAVNTMLIDRVTVTS